LLGLTRNCPQSKIWPLKELVNETLPNPLTISTLTLL